MIARISLGICQYVAPVAPMFGLVSPCTPRTQADVEGHAQYGGVEKVPPIYGSVANDAGERCVGAVCCKKLLVRRLRERQRKLQNRFPNIFKNILG